MSLPVFNTDSKKSTVILTAESVARFTRSQRNIKAYIDIVNSMRNKGKHVTAMQLNEIFDKAKNLL